MSKEYSLDFQINFGPDGQLLIPVVAQDALSKDVLILAYVNQAAFEATLSSGYATFWSRSRNELWKKGATSGDLLKIVEIRTNCEQNSLLFMVQPEGKGACHARKENGDPYTTCYYRRLNPQGNLEIIE